MSNQQSLNLLFQINDDQSAKALIAFGADINTLTQTSQAPQTPLDIVHDKHRDTSQIPQILKLIGGKRADDTSDDDSDDENGLNYEVVSTDDCFTMKPVLSGSSVDPQELSARLSAVNDDGDRDEVDYQDYQHPSHSLELPSLPEGAWNCLFLYTSDNDC